MKTKIIPFDLETAKKIQAGDIEGCIVCKEDHLLKPARIICWDRKPSYPIVALVSSTSDFESIICFSYKGEDGNGSHELYIKLPLTYKDYTFKLYDLNIFKPFDKVLVRQEGGVWCPRLFDFYDGEYWAQDGESYDYCIPYRDNDYLIGTDDEPKEE